MNLDCQPFAGVNWVSRVVVIDDNRDSFHQTKNDYVFQIKKL